MISIIQIQFTHNFSRTQHYAKGLLHNLFCGCIFPIHENLSSCIFVLFSWHLLWLRHSCGTGTDKAKDCHHLMNSEYRRCDISFLPTLSFGNSPTIFNRKYNVSLRSFLPNCSPAVGGNWVQRLILANRDGTQICSSSSLPHGVTKGRACTHSSLCSGSPVLVQIPVQHPWHPP